MGRTAAAADSSARDDRRLGGRASSSGGQLDDLWLLARLLRRAGSYWPHIAGVFVVNLFATPLALLEPLPLKLVVDSVLGDHPVPAPLSQLVPAGASQADLLLLAVGMILAIALATRVQELAAALLRTWTGERLVLDLRADLFGHVQRLAFGGSDRRATADSIYRIQYDAQVLQSVAIDGLIPFVAATATVAAMIYVTALIDLQLALVALAVAPCLLLVTGRMRRRLRRGSRELRRLESGALSVVQEVLSAVRVVSAFGQEERERRQFVDRSLSGLRTRLRLVVAEGESGILVGLITAGGMGAAVYLGVSHVQAGLITLGELLLVLGYFAQMYKPLATMGRKAARFQANLAGAERVFDLLDEVPGVADRPDARRLGRAAGSFELDGVSFGYEPGRPILRAVSLTVPAGRRVGITGSSGTGKTTLVNLLGRFYDPTAGRILLDGVDLREYQLATLRAQFAIVLQEPVLFSTTIAENVAYGRPQASRAEIEAAAEAAGAAAFIERLPDGYETVVGERGMDLSGGERQRIALARAFLKDAPVLILDEPTSAVDVETEAGILAALEALMRGRTVFVIAHRASTLALCDMLVRIEGDRVSASTPGKSTVPAAAADADDRAVVAAAVESALGATPLISAVRRRPFPGATSYEAEVLRLDVVGGPPLELFLKDYRSSRLPKDDLEARADREIAVYRELLGEGGTARFLGAVTDERRRWLLLEYLAGAVELASLGFDAWLEAAAWLGRHQGRFVAEAGRLEACPYLIRHDRDYLRRKAEAAYHSVAQIDGPLAMRLRAAFAEYDRLVEVMSAQPVTLVHGSYRPQNILVDSGTGRVCPVDWELAGIGSPLYDLAFIAQGFEGRELERLVGAWREEAEPRGVPVPELPRYVLDCFRLHRVARSLADAVALRFPVRAVERFVVSAERLRESLA